jgi:antitoxin FitA
MKIKELACNDSIDYDAFMPVNRPGGSTLMIRKVDASLKERLRVRAARNGRSMEAELRQILTDALAKERGSEPNLAEAIRRRFAPLGGVKLERHPPVPVRKPAGFD